MKRPKIPKLKIVLWLLVFCFCAQGLAQENSLLSLDLKEVDLKDALKIIAQASGMNIITDKDVKAVVNITLKDASWQAALDNILKTNELTHRIEGNTIRIMTLATVKKEEEMLPLTTRVITLNFAKANDLKTSLSKILSSRGSMEVNVPTNSLIISDTPEVLAKVEELAQQLDIRTPQVMIKALIMSIKLTDTNNFGIDWTATHKEHHRTEEGIRSLTQDLDLTTSHLSLLYGKSILPSWEFNATVEFYTQTQKATILANPHLLTLNNRDAQIELIEQVPYTSLSESTEGGQVSTTQFKDVGIKLYVTPQITKDKFVSLSVKVEQSYLAGYVGMTNEPQIDSRKTETNFMLKDGETAVIGGLRKKDDTTTVNKIPLLGDLPFLGKFFRRETKEVVNTELLVFITPDIVEESLMSKEEEKKLEKSKVELRSSKTERDGAIANALAEQRQKEEQERLPRQKEEKERQAEEERRQAELKKQQREQEKIKQKEESERQKQIASQEKEKERQAKEEAQAKEKARQEKQRQAQLKKQEEQERLQEKIEKQLRAAQRKKELAQKKELRNEISSLYKEAITYYKNNQFGLAINTFRKILAKDPEQTKAKKYLEIYIPKRIEKLR